MTLETEESFNQRLKVRKWLLQQFHWHQLLDVVMGVALGHGCGCAEHWFFLQFSSSNIWTMAVALAPPVWVHGQSSVPQLAARRRVPVTNGAALAMTGTGVVVAVAGRRRQVMRATTRMGDGPTGKNDWWSSRGPYSSVPYGILGILMGSALLLHHVLSCTFMYILHSFLGIAQWCLTSLNLYHSYPSWIQKPRQSL